MCESPIHLSPYVMCIVMIRVNMQIFSLLKPFVRDDLTVTGKSIHECHSLGGVLSFIEAVF